MTSSAKLIKDVQKWGYERGITKAENAHMQTMKTVEEIGELAGAIVRFDRESAVDAFGDILVTMILHNECLGRKLDFILIDGIESTVDFVPDVFTAMNEFIAQLGKPDLYTVTGMYDRLKLLEVLRRATADHLSCEDFPILLECLQAVHDEIKDRKGKMQGGVFVKEDDLQPKPEEPTPEEEKAELADEETKAGIDALAKAVGTVVETESGTYELPPTVAPSAVNDNSIETSRVVKRKSRKKKDAE